MGKDGTLMMDNYIKNRNCACMRCRMSDMMGPAVLVTAGAMWLLGNVLHREHIMTFVAVLLIVIGGVKMLQSSASTEGHRQPYPYQTGDVPPAPAATPQTDDRQVNNNG
jgi:hypothetical protein